MITGLGWVIRIVSRILISISLSSKGFLSLFPDAPVLHLGLYREKVMQLDPFNSHAHYAIDHSTTSGILQQASP